jgi:hypothetical protein
MPLGQPAIPILCPKCKQPTRLFERLWSSKTSSYVRIYKCQCGELVWDD